MNEVQGKVIYQDKPLAGALVTFHPKGQKDVHTVPSTGMTKEDGTFALTTGKKDGAPAGEYLVTIICTKMPDSKKGLSTGGVDSEDILQGAYAIRDASKITVTVANGKNQLEPFNLK